MADSFLNFRRVAFAYPGVPDPVLHDLDFSIPPGWTGVVGANGAGKTTLLHLAAGLLDPSDGLLDGPGGILCAQRTDVPPEDLGAFLLGEDAAEEEGAGLDGDEERGLAGVAFLADLLEDAHQPLRGDRGVDFDMHDLAVEVVDDVEGAEAAATGQRIQHEVGGPDGIGVLGHVQRHALALG